MPEIKEGIINQIVELKLMKPQTQEVKLKIQKLQQLLNKGEL
jgi:hypothetical protein|tara:strand:- start:4894 stop:5019 length:126 start_codon:yes stop_codon:yes gene_type:complete